MSTLVVASVALAACNDGADFGALSLGSAGGADGGAGAVGLSSSGTCTEAQPVEKLDPTALPACAPVCGGAHCVPADKVPAVSRSFFASCGGGYCIPDTLIRSGAAKPPSCKSLNNADGVCLSVCVPQVAEHADALPKANCAADERCAPCVNPNDGQPTGACAIGQPVDCKAPAGGSAAPGNGNRPALKCPHEGPPVLDPQSLESCGEPGSAAHCLAASLVTPPELKSRLKACASGGFCVPDKLIASGGRFIPKSCTSTGGAEGRCQSRVLPDVAAQPYLPRAGCDASERCVPCSNPVDGSDTGACKTSCDPGPTAPKVLFADCCGARGKCVPKSSVPSDLTSRLQADSCGAADLCAPTEHLQPAFTPTSCSGFSFMLGGQYSGVCLSNCLDFGSSSFALVRGDCDTDHTCAPCTDQNGAPTGAPGCN